MRLVRMAPPSSFVALRRVILGGAEGLKLILSIRTFLSDEGIYDSFGG